MNNTVVGVTTSSAVPATLVAYASNCLEMDDELSVSGRQVSGALQAFYAASPDHTPSGSDPGADAARHAVRNQEADAWVARVGSRFLVADGGGGFFCSIPPRPMTIDDALLADVGFPSRREAAIAGRAFANEVRAALNAGAAIERDVFERWRDEMVLHANDAAFAVGFFERLGADRLHRLPVLVEANWPGDEFGRPEWGLDALSPFSRALAAAMGTRRDVVTPSRYRLDASFVDDVLTVPYSYDADEPDERHLALLFCEGVFPADVLVRLGTDIVSIRLANGSRGGPIGMTPWAAKADPVANVLDAISRNPDASLAYLESSSPWLEANTLQFLLERWGEIDGDSGIAGAAVLRGALTHPERARSGALFDGAVRALAEIGELRNFFAIPALADAVAFHIDRVATTAAEEGDVARLVDTHRVLALLLADTEAAATIFDAALQETADTFARADDRDRLGSDVWRVGGLLGLLLSADTAADLSDAEERVARRDALLEGIGQITDLALTFTRGRWIPFATAGRDALLDSFRDTSTVEEALADLAAVQDEYRMRMSELIAARLVHNGVLDPKPASMSVRDWVNSDAVRDAISGLRTQAGQRFDEVLALLEHER